MNLKEKNGFFSLVLFFSISLVYRSKGANVPNTFQSLLLFHNLKVKT